MFVRWRKTGCKVSTVGGNLLRRSSGKLSAYFADVQSVESSPLSPAAVVRLDRAWGDFNSCHQQQVQKANLENRSNLIRPTDQGIKFLFSVDVFRSMRLFFCC
jgi:hypothetical protein